MSVESWHTTLPPIISGIRKVCATSRLFGRLGPPRRCFYIPLFSAQGNVPRCMFSVQRRYRRRRITKARDLVNLSHLVVFSNLNLCTQPRAIISSSHLGIYVFRPRTATLLFCLVIVERFSSHCWLHRIPGTGRVRLTYQSAHMNVHLQLSNPSRPPLIKH